jgi:hypothetical protein
MLFNLAEGYQRYFIHKDEEEHYKNTENGKSGSNLSCI